MIYYDWGGVKYGSVRSRSDEAMPNLLCGNTMSECDACFDRYYDSIVAKGNNDPIIQSKKANRIAWISIFISILSLGAAVYSLVFRRG